MLYNRIKIYGPQDDGRHLYRGYTISPAPGGYRVDAFAGSLNRIYNSPKDAASAIDKQLDRKHLRRKS